MTIQVKAYPEVKFHIDIPDVADNELITYWRKEFGLYLHGGIEGLEIVGDLLGRHGELKLADIGNQDFVTVLLTHWVFKRLRNSLQLLLGGHFPDAVGPLRQAHEGVGYQLMNLSPDFATKWLHGRNPALSASAIPDHVGNKKLLLKGLSMAELFHPNQKAVRAEIGFGSDMYGNLAGSKDREMGHIHFQNWLATLGIELLILSKIYKNLWLQVPEFASRTKNLDRLAREHENFVRKSFPGRVSL